MVQSIIPPKLQNEYTNWLVANPAMQQSARALGMPVLPSTPPAGIVGPSDADANYAKYRAGLQPWQQEAQPAAQPQPMRIFTTSGLGGEPVAPAASPKPAIDIGKMASQLNERLQQQLDIIDQGANRPGYRQGDIGKATAAAGILQNQLAALTGAGASMYGAEQAATASRANQQVQASAAKQSAEIEAANRLALAAATGEYGIGREQIQSGAALQAKREELAARQLSPEATKQALEARSAATGLALLQQAQQEGATTQDLYRMWAKMAEPDTKLVFDPNAMPGQPSAPYVVRGSVVIPPMSSGLGALQQALAEQGKKK